MLAGALYSFPGPTSSIMNDDLYRSSFGSSGGYNQSVNPHQQQQQQQQQQHHQRHGSGSSHSSYPSLATPADSPPLIDFTAGGALTGGGIGGIGGPQAGAGKLLNAARHEPNTRRARHDASASPYPHHQHPGRSASFSGSDSGHRSDSSDPDDANALFPGLGGNSYGAQQQQQQYGIAPAMYARSTSGLVGQGAQGQGALDSQSAGGYQRQSMGSDEALVQLAQNVRAATTTSASDRAKHIFVQAWLNANYAPYQDGNVPRQGLYNSYRRVCDEHQIPHVNTATLGKAIRLCFPAIKTRRLGVRGNSKYHYCGIRPATAAEAEWLQDFIARTNNNTTGGAAGGNARVSSNNSRPASQSGRSSSANDDSPEEDDDDGEYNPGGGNGGHSHSHSHSSSSHGGGGGGLGGHGLAPLALRSGRRSPNYFSMSDDKTPTVAGFNTAQSQIFGTGPSAGAFGGGNNGGGYASLRRRGAASGEGIVASNASFPGGVAGNATGTVPGSIRPGGAGPGYGTLRPGQSVRQLRGFPDVEEAIGSSSSSTANNGNPTNPSSSSSDPSSSNPDSPSSGGGGASTSKFAGTAREVWRWFEEHLDQLVESVRSFRFDAYEAQVRNFWSGLGGEHREIVHAPAVQGLMARADALVYDEILEILRSQLLAAIPAHVLTSLRQLADKMEKVLLGALDGYGSTFVEPKVELGARFGHLVLRFLDIYQVTQALSSVMANPKQLEDMSRSWREIDFESVRNQAALVCNCRHEDLHGLLEIEFVGVLDGLQGSSEPVRDIILWADQVCERLIGAHTVSAVGATGLSGAGGPGGEDRTSMSSRSLLIRWGYVTSQIMRDLTIRSDAAFGAFQILKLFMDDWIALNVLRNVALSTNSVAASVEPTLPPQQFLLSPGGSNFTSGNHTSIHPHHSQMMAHTPTTASMIAAMGDPFGQAHHHGPAGGYHYEPLSFTSPMHTSVSTGDSLPGPSSFDFTSGAMDVSTGGPGGDEEMSTDASGAVNDAHVKLEGA